MQNCKTPPQHCICLKLPAPNPALCFDSFCAFGDWNPSQSAIAVPQTYAATQARIAARQTEAERKKRQKEVSARQHEEIKLVAEITSKSYYEAKKLTSQKRRYIISRANSELKCRVCGATIYSGYHCPTHQKWAQICAAYAKRTGRDYRADLLTDIKAGLTLGQLKIKYRHTPKTLARHKADILAGRV